MASISLIKWWPIWKIKGFLCHFLWRSEIRKRFAPDVFQEQLAEKDILIDALKEESRCLGVVDSDSPMLKMKGQRRDQGHKNPRLIIPSLALGNHTTFAFKILRMKQEEIMRIEMEMKEALQDEQLRNQETATYRPCIDQVYRPSMTLGRSVLLRRACPDSRDVRKVFVHLSSRRFGICSKKPKRPAISWPPRKRTRRTRVAIWYNIGNMSFKHTWQGMG